MLTWFASLMKAAGEPLRIAQSQGCDHVLELTRHSLSRSASSSDTQAIEDECVKPPAARLETQARGSITIRVSALPGGDSDQIRRCGGCGRIRRSLLVEGQVSGD
jgi:hypothetical protein